MLCYPNGTKISVGDIIWYSKYIVRVVNIVESEDALTALGSSEPGITICWTYNKRKLTEDAYLAQSSFLESGVALYNGKPLDMTLRPEFLQSGSMCYPSGQKVNIGDIIWWNERCHIGQVNRIIETKEDQNNYEQDEPGIIICVDPTGKNLNAANIFYPESDFVGEGIDLFDDDPELLKMYDSDRGLKK